MINSQTLQRQLEVLKNPGFFKLWMSQATSQLTNYILSFAILIKVYELTQSSLQVSLIIIAFGLATVCFGALAGVYADRFDRRKLLTIVNFAQAASVALYFVVGGNVWGLVIITFLYSSLNQFYLPAEAPSIPLLVPKEQILVANSYFAFTGSVALIIGFASAGPLILFLGESAPYTLAIGLLTIAGIATLMLPSLKPEHEVETSHSLNKIWYEFTEGIKYFWNNKFLHFPLISLFCIQIVNGMLITIAPAFMQNALGIKIDRASLVLVGPLGVGILLGALFLGSQEKRFSKKDLVFLGFLGMGVMIFLLSFINYFTHKYVFYSVLGLMIGFFNAHIFAPSHSILQTYALAHVRGRVYGSLYVLLQMAATLPTIIIGVLADRIALTYVLAFLGVLLLIFGLSLDRKEVPGKI